MTREDFNNKMVDFLRNPSERKVNELFEQVTVPCWISVEDELPKDDVYVATINKFGLQEVRYYSRGKWYSNFGNEYGSITHWYHLPQPPLVTDLNKKDLPPLSCQEGNILVEEEGGEE